MEGLKGKEKGRAKGKGRERLKGKDLYYKMNGQNRPLIKPKRRLVSFVIVIQYIHLSVARDFLLKIYIYIVNLTH